ncbi:Astra associated protein 1 Asa1 [Knufia peltigerae]|uniref:ASTRA-associated protein 1 n=1 Tax=Knufia peltigerae TaxID=1002370 RepID=A0AA38XWW8_9EURO|nr:Astra associated protein 1 Asa1 [Knufia peltigerae]
MDRPAVPTYILRGHDAPIHALRFYSRNAYLASGDSEGWLIIWSLATKRPVAVWKGHEGAVMCIRHWTHKRLVSHGRDHKLRVWQVQDEDLADLTTNLPGDKSSVDRREPWLLHSISVNALNFCAFSMCNELPGRTSRPETEAQLVASPNGLDSGGIDIFQLPSERRVSQIASAQDSPTGMVMAVSIFHDNAKSRLLVVSGYEDGRVMVHVRTGNFDKEGGWQKVTSSKLRPGSQPILSLEISPSRDYFITSGVDSWIAKYPLDLPDGMAGESRETHRSSSIKTKHAGQQGLSIRSDGKIFATAGWDARIRVYSTRTMKELAVLQWHQQGCYATSFADLDLEANDLAAPTEYTGSDLSTQSNEILARPTALDIIKRKREEKARSIHWLAAGGKDGKISLWNIY